MEPTRPPPRDEEYAELVRRARAMTPGEKLLAGPRLFDQACAELEGRIRAHFPAATEQQARALVRQVVDWMRWREEPYTPCPLTHRA